jgi:hypothetical protein
MNTNTLRTKRRKLNKRVARRLDMDCELSCHSSNSTVESNGCEVDDNFGTNSTGFGGNVEFTSPVRIETNQCSDQQAIDEELKSDSAASSYLFNDVDSYEGGDNIIADLRNVALSMNITHQDLSKLLRVLNRYHPELPIDARTLLSSSVKKVMVSDMEPGKYFHFGLKSGIKFLIDKLSITETINLQVNVDGVPVHSSAMHSFWPILCSIRGYPTSVFIVGAYFGENKPSSVEDYLRRFLDELLEILPNGIGDLVVRIHTFCCDTPARHFLLNVKSHGSYFGCEKCIQKGKTIDNRRVFIETNAQSRTDSSFRNKSQPEHHKGPSPLEVIQDIDMIATLPGDYMHSVCKGVTLKLLEELRSGDYARLSAKLLNEMSEFLNMIRSDIPSDFNRRPRSIKHLGTWKATELRLFLLYLSPIVIPKFCSMKYSQCFVTFSVVIRIFCSTVDEEFLLYAKELVIQLIKQFQEVFGDKFLVYNVHSLVHLYDDVNRFGKLDTISCFRYENFLRFLKRSVRGTRHPLQQLVKRVLESDQTLGHYVLPVVMNELLYEFYPTDESLPQIDLGINVRYYKKLVHNNSVLQSDSPNQFVFLRGEPPRPFKIAYFAVNSERIVYLVGWFLNVVGNIFSNPLPSAKIGFVKIRGTRTNDIKAVKFTDVTQKAMCLAEKYFISLLHSF